MEVREDLFILHKKVYEYKLFLFRECYIAIHNASPHKPSSRPDGSTKSITASSKLYRRGLKIYTDIPDEQALMGLKREAAPPRVPPQQDDC
jgi:hypothetical protein